jgi:beta-N-acetylhexosaminidase
MKLLATLALATSLVVGCTGVAGAVPVGRPSERPTSSSTASPSAKAPPRSTAITPSLAHLIGQKLVIRMDGTTPSADLLGRIRRGEVGGIILLGFNITTHSALVSLTAKLQAEAAAGHQPPLLIAVDQEGGAIKRIAWAPPTLSPPQIGDQAISVARTQGAQTGAALHDLGINVDFAPVADVPATKASFMYRQGRTFSFSSTRTASRADAFATGLESTGVTPTMKHFPGLGFAAKNTDAYVVKILQSKQLLDAGLRPYRTAIAHDIPLIMLSNATYTALDANNAAGWSHAIGTTLLRDELGFTGVTITDSLDGTAHDRILALKAGF